MKRLIGWKYRAAIAALAVLLPVLAASPARAWYGPPPVTCPPGSSCYLYLVSHIHFGGSGYAPGGGVPIPVVPPPCPWDPVGNVQTGSQYLLGYYQGAAPAPNAPNGQYASYTQAEQMIASHSTEPGEWYFRPDRRNQSPAQRAQCAAEPRWFFAVPGEPLPGSTLAPVSLAGCTSARCTDRPTPTCPRSSG